MKKNAMLKIAAILMVAVLLTTCAISSTFAKYTSEASDSADARVAKWGVTANMNIDSLFGTSYANGNKLVTSSDTTNVMAPGTYDEITLSTQISGTPEVSLNITYTADLDLQGWGTYCPLVFKVGTNTFAMDASLTGEDDINTTAKLEAAVEAAIVAFSVENVAPNQNLNDQADIFISWEWAFDSTDNVNDAADTLLGNNAAGLNGGTAATVELTVGVVIEQTGSAASAPAVNG